MKLITVEAAEVCLHPIPSSNKPTWQYVPRPEHGQLDRLLGRLAAGIMSRLAASYLS